MNIGIVELLRAGARYGTEGTVIADLPPHVRESGIFGVSIRGEGHRDVSERFDHHGTVKWSEAGGSENGLQKYGLQKGARL